MDGQFASSQPAWKGNVVMAHVLLCANMHICELVHYMICLQLHTCTSYATAGACDTRTRFSHGIDIQTLKPTHMLIFHVTCNKKQQKSGVSQGLNVIIMSYVLCPLTAQSLSSFEQNPSLKMINTSFPVFTFFGRGGSEGRVTSLTINTQIMTCVPVHTASVFTRNASNV